MCVEEGRREENKEAKINADNQQKKIFFLFMCKSKKKNFYQEKISY